MNKTDGFFSKAKVLNLRSGIKALLLNLENRTTEELLIPQKWLDMYISGPALAGRIWSEYSSGNTNPIVIIPSASFGNSLTIAFRSPQTGAMALNVCSSSFSGKLSNCGYGALVIFNKLEKPGIVSISRESIDFEYTDRFFGKRVSDSESDLAKDQSALLTGPAADSRVSFASAFTDGRITGRGGLGYVMAHKNLKSIIITNDVNSYDPFENPNIIDVVSNAQKEGWAPIDNYTKRTDPRLFHLSSSEVSRKFPKDMRTPPFDILLMFGPNCGIYDLECIVSRYALCLELGMDPISVANILAYAKVHNKFKIDLTDNKQIQSLMYLMATKTGMGSNLVSDYKINGLECGPFDFRGNFAQALNSALGRHFYNYFALEKNLTKKNPAFWQVLNEELVLGLECFGVSPSVLYTEIKKLKPLTFFCVSHSKFFAQKFFSLKKVTEKLSDYFNCTITIQDIRSAGAKARYIIDKVNSALKPDMPQFFRSDSSSNYRTDDIVPFNSLIGSYAHERDYSFAVKFPYAE